MKKMMLLAPVAALALAACSNDSVVENTANLNAQTGTELALRPVVQGSTRGTVLTDGNIGAAPFSGFSVNAKITSTKGEFWKTADGEEPTSASDKMSEFSEIVTKNGSKWEYIGGEKYYWSGKSVTADFKAITPSSMAEGDITIEPSVADQKDIAVAFNSGAASDFTSGVPLNFQHVTSQVEIKALNKDNTYNIYVAGVKIENVNNTGKLTLPTASTLAADFSWAAYTPWSNVSGTVDFTSGENTVVLTGSSTKLTTAAKSIMGSADGVMFMMPQQLVAADLTAASINGSYIAVLVRVTKPNKVAKFNNDGKLVYDNNGTETAIDFDHDLDGGSNYTAYTTTKYDKSNASQWKYENHDLIMIDEEVVYPKVGMSNAALDATGKDLYAYVAVPISTLWEPGKKYTYTLQFSKDGIGKVDPEQPANDIDDALNFPKGTGDTAFGDGEDILDNSVPLYFTLTVENWTDVAESENM